LKFAEPRVREQIFTFFPHEEQIELLQTQDRAEVAELIVELASDDRVDLLEEVSSAVVDEILPLLPADVRREILRLGAIPKARRASDDDRGGNAKRVADRSRGTR